MIRHIVFLRFDSAASEADIDRYVEALGGLPRQIPSIIEFVYGRDVGRSYRADLATNWDFVVSATFMNLDDYLGYATHPEHLKLVQDHLIDLMADRAALQIEVTDGSSWATANAS